ncbi:S8 family serine peptidase [Ancylobacter lacus]|uniref:S8 family serine peptidase n=1 Tax=Ancylobacter lacus TaxID=2579970 RepID=UPI001BCE56EC|nr:S8 family serine peptidase [Ancylobacter lacus]MBS7538021.1 S8 family serine peptidase [Ancylobacter lacus]
MAKEIANSTFLQATSYGLVPDSELTTSTLAQIKSAYGASSALNAADWASTYGSDLKVKVALVLDRAEDASTLLDGDWAERQNALPDSADTKAFEDFWNQYGAKDSDYAAVTHALKNMDGVKLLKDSDGYVTSAESRTVWVELTAEGFHNLFGKELYGIVGDNYAPAVWEGNVSLPDEIANVVGGFWVDQVAAADGQNMGAEGVTLSQGAQGTANYSYGDAKGGVTGTPTALADYYNFPLNAQNLLDEIDTPTVGLVEPRLDQASYDLLLQGLNDYRTKVLGIAPLSKDELLRTQPDPSSGTKPDHLKTELTLDVSIVSGAAPSSDMVFYSKLAGDSTTFAATQQAIWDLTNNPAVLTSSYSDTNRYAADTPFAWAYDQLMEDGVLRNVTLLMSAGDGGSSQEYANGVTTVHQTHANQWALVVSGTSLSAVNTAEQDTTVTTLVDKALALDLDTVFDLTASGLKVLPTDLPDLATDQPLSDVAALLEAVWNQYYIKDTRLSPGYADNFSGAGGVDDVQPIPQYQLDFGLVPSDAFSGATGRGVPDVAALAGGSMFYYVLTTMREGSDSSKNSFTYGPNGGTSAATPMWASLTAQIDAVFEDAGLPHLGYYNDLLYQSAAVTPGAFNDVSLGNNVSTYYVVDKDTAGAVYDEGLGSWIMPTGLGYAAEDGYDLASGLGTPNGLLLARTLMTLAETQLHGEAPETLSGVGSFTGSSTVDQTFLVQSTLGGGGAVEIAGEAFDFGTAGSTAWTARLAQQALQSDFSSDLTRFLDGASQSTAATLQASAGQVLGVSVDSAQASLYQSDLTNDYGFVTWGTANGGVTLARPVAIATTPDGANDVDAVVRLRQNGVYDSSLMVYKVDDLDGRIGDLQPGDAGYADAAAARAYLTTDGSHSIDGPGYGAYTQAEIAGVDNGDIVAMALTTAGETYWGFAEANELSGDQYVTHLWSYGLNTWGFEDTRGGGDRDYNDLIVGLDFTSPAGRGLLV